MDSVSAADDPTPHLMRIASHGKVSLLVTFALKFLKENPTRPLVLHTLPHKSDTDAETTTTEPSAKKRKIEPSTTNVSRLISIVEIIKREFKETPLYQYNEIGCLDVPGPREKGPGIGVPSEPGEGRQAGLQQALEGKNHLPIQRTPFMKITLSQAELPQSMIKGATYQPPVAKKKSRGAKARSRRRGKNETAAATEAQDTDNDVMDVIPT